MLCEGGPHLNAQLLAAGLVDELFLTLGPLLAGGAATGEALRILAGIDLDPPVELELLGVLKHESHLFLRYGERRPPRQASGLRDGRRDPLSVLLSSPYSSRVPPLRPSRSVRIATFSTTLLGTITVPSSVTSVV